MNKRMIILLASVLAFVVGWGVLFLLPMQKETAHLKKRLQTFQEEEKRKISDQKIEWINRAVDSLKIRFDHQMRRIYSENKLLELGRDMESVGKQFGLELASIAPDYDNLAEYQEKKEEISQMPVIVEFRGDFRALSRFLDNSNNFPFVFIIREVSLERKSQSSSELGAILTGVVVMRKEGADEKNLNDENQTNRA